MDALIEALERAIPKLAAGQQEFARSLIKQHRSRGLTDKQEYWVRRLVEGSIAPPPEQQLAAAGIGRIVALIETARANGLKFPKIRLNATDGRRVVIARAGEKSKYTGDLMLTDGQPFGMNRYYGRVSADGVLHPSRDCDNPIRGLLTALASDPAGTAAKHGKLTGECCFCSKALDTPESTAVGYGPVCAKKFNLPWGTAKADAAKMLEAA